MGIILGEGWKEQYKKRRLRGGIAHHKTEKKTALNEEQL